MKPFDVLKKAYRSVVRINDTPLKIAAGFGLGVALGVMPGTGPIAAVVVAVALKLNKAASLAGSLITNTWLSIPVFFASLKVGAAVIGIDGATARERWLELTHNFDWATLFSVPVFTALLPLFVGYLIVSFALGLIFFLAVFLIIIFFRKRTPPDR